MINVRCLLALMSICFFAPSIANAAPLNIDLGARAVIFDEAYKLGVGGELGLIMPYTPNMDLGLHLNFTNFSGNNENTPSVNEFGGYVTAYFHPAINQGFSLNLGPHAGFAIIEDAFLDLGGDVKAVFKATQSMNFYGAFIPSVLIGKESYVLIRIGIGLEFKTGI